jgi:GDPmannose 4,6-dehydratase
MKKVLIIGHTGQDGKILWNQLANQGCSLIGISRSSTLVSHGLAVDLPVNDYFNNVTKLVKEFGLDEIYYLAAYHQSSEESLNQDNNVWENSWRTNVNNLQFLLEKLRIHSSKTRTFYASSSRIFGATRANMQTEETVHAPICIYGVTKSAGMSVVNYYREHHSLFVSSGILYNHESPFRADKYITKRIVNQLIAVRNGYIDHIEVGSLDAKVDWGYANDYTQAMQLMLQCSQPSDRIIATGKMHSVRDFICHAAKTLRVDWEKFVIERPTILKRSPQNLCGNPTRLVEETGWKHSVNFEQLVQILVSAELEKNVCCNSKI